MDLNGLRERAPCSARQSDMREGRRGGQKEGGRGRAMTDWVLLSGPGTQSGKVNHYLCLTRRAHASSLLYLEGSTFTEEHT